MQNAQQRRQFALSCPNCRGSGTIIAVWDYIDSSRITQTINGHEVPNLLTNGASFHHIATPPSPRSVHSTTTPPEQVMFTGPIYHIQTRLSDGRQSIIVDPGSVGNLCGDKWAKEVARTATQNGHKPSYEKRPRPLKVSGVGNGAQECHYDCKLPVSLRHANNKDTSTGHITIPAVHNSELPGLLGLTALRNNRTLIDFTTLKMYMMGPGDNELEKHLPPGTDTYQLELAPSGHMVLPCCEYQPGSSSSDHSLTLMSRSNATSSGSPRAEATGIPPPPSCPPVLPTNHRHEEVRSPPPESYP